jgi:hypothetical protein
MGGFLDQPGDFSAGEEFFEGRKQRKLEATGNDKHTGGRQAFLVKELDR